MTPKSGLTAVNKSKTMNYTISKDRKTLTVTVTPDEREILKRMDEEIHQDATMCDFLEPLTCNSELEWINPADTGDLTDAPMLGILGEDGLRDYTVFLPNHGLVETGCDGHNITAQPILERWTYSPYQVRSVLEDLRDKGECVFTS